MLTLNTIHLDIRLLLPRELLRHSNKMLTREFYHLIKCPMWHEDLGMLRSITLNELVQGQGNLIKPRVQSVATAGVEEVVAHTN
jgi:hypothetical protein